MNISITCIYMCTRTKATTCYVYTHPQGCTFTKAEPQGYIHKTHTLLDV